MITRKNNKFKKIIFAAIVLLIFILALRYYTRSGGGPDATGLKTSGETGVAAPFNKIPELKTEPVSPSVAPSTPEAAGTISGAAESSEASLNVKSVTAQPAAPHSVKQTAIAGKKGIITGNGVNVRRESRIDATNANVVTKVNKGELVQIIGAEKPDNDNRQWYNIKLKNGKTGFVREDLIKIE